MRGGGVDSVAGRRREVLREALGMGLGDIARVAACT